MFTTAQAAKALCVAPTTLRNQRARKGLGREISPGRTGWTFEELEQLRRPQNTPRWDIRFEVTQLDGPPRKGSIMIWAPSEETAKSRAESWFWNAVFFEEPGNWGIPLKYSVLEIALHDA